MQTECSAKPSEFAPVEGRPVMAEFEGGAVTSDAGGLLLGAADKAIGLTARNSRWPAARGGCDGGCGAPCARGSW